MATIEIMIGVAVMNAATFTGENYLAKALGGGDDAALDEKSVTTRPSRLIKRLTLNTIAKAPSSLTGSKRMRG